MDGGTSQVDAFDNTVMNNDGYGFLYNQSQKSVYTGNTIFNSLFASIALYRTFSINSTFEFPLPLSILWTGNNISNNTIITKPTVDAISPQQKDGTGTQYVGERLVVEYADFKKNLPFIGPTYQQRVSSFNIFNNNTYYISDPNCIATTIGSNGTDNSFNYYIGLDQFRAYTNYDVGVKQFPSIPTFTYTALTQNLYSNSAFTTNPTINQSGVGGFSVTYDTSGQIPGFQNSLSVVNSSVQDIGDARNFRFYGLPFGNLTANTNYVIKTRKFKFNLQNK
jgi:hypothetical protein